MYSRNTDRGGRRIKLPPGYDGSAFRHDTGEVRQIGADTEMKIHSPKWSDGRPEAVEKREDYGTMPGHLQNRQPGHFSDSMGSGDGEGEEPIADMGRETGFRESEEETGSREAGQETGSREAGQEMGFRESGKETAFQDTEQENRWEKPGERCVLPAGKDSGSFLEGLLASLGSEDLLLLLVILLLLADGSDAWDLILLLGVLLAVK
ncbi:MAG: hypothetical protein IJX14_10690 [Clostridia bacterium]|nr:hypothetical protein [Clostridia bacterium]